ncbi:MAG: Kelch repeat-containing protein, partial [Limisphaerales bacterium]
MKTKGLPQWFAIVRIITLTLVLPSPGLRAQTNSWINPASGKWENTNSWSLNALPNSLQTIEITNDGTKIITVDQTTVQVASNSMTVASVEISANNTLLLTNLGTNIPFHVAGNIEAFNAGPILIYNSALIAGGELAEGPFVQTGGSVMCGIVVLAGNATYTLTNGSFQANKIWMIDRAFYQYGGNVTAGDVDAVGGPYYMQGGMLTSSSIELQGQQGGSFFSQDGGTNSTGALRVGAISESDFELANGVLHADSLSVVVDYGTDPAFFSQGNSTTIITNGLYLAGAAYHYAWDGTPAYVSIGSSTFIAKNLILDGQPGPCEFSVNDSTVSFSDSIEIRGATFAPGGIGISGGTLRCANVVNTGGTVYISQTGGNFIVTNLFVYSGYWPHALYGPTVPGVYSFSGGTLTASNIEIDAEMAVGDSIQANRITNSGYFQLSGTLDVGVASEHLGRFILASQIVTNWELPQYGLTQTFLNHAAINFTGNGAVLTFADSHTQSWSIAASLTVSNWNGSLTGNGNTQLKFGTSASGLTSAQVSKIRFLNPAGFPPGTYLATILNNGEVVPYAPSMNFTHNASSLAVNWSDTNFVLQTATNVTGPWFDLVTTNQHYTNNFTDPMRFFRLQKTGWHPGANMTETRDWHTATLLANGKVLVAGGVTFYGPQIWTDLYDPATQTWIESQMNSARAYHAAVALTNGMVLVAGGDSGGTILTSCEIYDPTTALWTNTGSLNVNRSLHTLTLLKSGKALAVGGYIPTTGNATATVEIYDPVTATWTLTNSLHTSRFAHT